MKPGKEISLQETEIRWLCQQVKGILLDQPTFLELEAPIKVCGDIHGQYYDLLRLFEYGGYPPETNYLFMGDYVDRGKQSLETISLLFAYKVKYAENFFLLRGNHETSAISRIYGFYDECKKRYSIKLWKIFSDCFNCLPVAALIDDKILCMHGGLSPKLNGLEDISKILRPTDVPEDGKNNFSYYLGLLTDLLWADPDNNFAEFGVNDRGVSFTFSENVIEKFLEAKDLDLICRAHQVSYLSTFIILLF